MTSNKNKKEIFEKLLNPGIIGVVRTEDSEKLVELSRALKKGGVKSIEIAMTTPNALQIIKEVTKKLENVLVGAGTVLDAETARSAILAGAEYVVSPTTDIEMIKTARRYGKVVAPGAFTPTEIMHAYQNGADIVKVFPASRLGPKFISDVKAPLPQVPLMPTGGVSKQNAGEFIEAGADVICAGSALIDKQAMEANNFDKITKNARDLVSTVKESKNKI